MKAAYYEKQGTAGKVLQIGEVPAPEAGTGEILVRIHASGINPSDVKYRSGWGGLPLAYPRVIPHNDGAGIIEAVGEGVEASRVGERVWIYEAQRDSAFGTAAELVAVPAHKVVRLPDNVNFHTAAALGVPAMTAHRCLFADGSLEGKIVLVSGGGGAVGSAAVQLAKWGGAHVIATAGRPESLQAAREAGADEVIDYKNEDVITRVKEINRKGVDRIVEVNFAANIQTDAKILKFGGVLASYSAENEPQPTIPFYDLMGKNITLQLVLVYTMTEAAHQAAIRDITTALEAGALRPHIGKTFSLDEVAAAHEAVESGQLTGKAIVIPE